MGEIFHGDLGSITLQVQFQEPHRQLYIDSKPRPQQMERVKHKYFDMFY
jgi:hypothetical protein